MMDYSPKDDAPQDKELAAHTRMEEQPATSRVRFVTQLPGWDKPLCSEFVQKSDRAGAIAGWMTQVRVYIANRKMEAMMQAAAEEKARRAANPSVVIAPAASVSTSASTVQTFIPLPLEMAKAQLKAANDRRDAAIGSIEAANAELNAATTARDQWNLVVQQLEGTKPQT